MVRVAAYCRISTDLEKNLLSMEKQIQSVLDLVPTNKEWKLVGIYTDQGITGTSIEKRNGFRRLLRHCEAGSIDLIITKSVSRFSRNTENLLSVLRSLRSLNIDVLFEKEGLRLSGLDDDFILTMYVAMAQKETINLAKNTEWSYEKKALLGNPVFPRTFGYDISKTSKGTIITINEAEAKAVKNIFNLYLKDTSLTDISKKLTQENIKTKAGGFLWEPNSIKGILKNIRYTGTAVFKGNYSTLKDLRPDQGKRKPIIIENHHPAIIDQATFDAAKRKMDTLKGFSKTRTKKQYPFSNRLTCGHCGKKINIASQFNNSRIWQCSTSRSNQELCVGRGINENIFINLILEELPKAFDMSTPEEIHLLIKKLEDSISIDAIESSRLKQIIAIAEINQKIAFSPNKESLRDHKKILLSTFLSFEKFAEMAERDFEIRKNAISFLRKLTVRHPLSFSTEEKEAREIAIAFAPFITVYSKDAVKIHWLDGSLTISGDCIQRMTAAAQLAENDILKAKKNQGNKVNEHLQDNLTKRTVIPYNQKAIIASRGLITSKQLNIGEYDSPLRVCAYCRTSTQEESQLSSLALQISYYTHLIMTNEDWTFSGIYTDHGLSGTQISTRPDFLRMLEDAKAGLFDLIIVKSVSRFSRNVLDTLKTVRDLRALPNKVSVFFENEGIYTNSSQGELMLSLYATVAEQEIISHSQNVSFSKIKLIEQGKHRHPGTMPYGYRRGTNNTWEIIPEQASTIKMIFEETAAGNTAFTIIKRLSQEGIQSPGGKNIWFSSTIYGILSNDSYLGSLRYQKKFVKDTLTHEVLRNRGERDQYIIENHHPAIISKELWNKAQASRNIRKGIRKSPINKKVNDKFRNIFRCHLCGAQIIHTETKNGLKFTNHWFCQGTFRDPFDNKCSASRVRESLIEYAFMELLYLFKKNPQWKNQALKSLDNFFLSEEEKQKISEWQLLLNRIYQEIHQSVQEKDNTTTKDFEVITGLTEKALKIKEQLYYLYDKEKKAKKSIANIEKLDEIISSLPEIDFLKFRPLFNLEAFRLFIKDGSQLGIDQVIFNTIWEEKFTIEINKTKVYKLPIWEDLKGE